MLQHGHQFASHQLERIQSVQKHRQDVNLHENLIDMAQYCVKGLY